MTYRLILLIALVFCSLVSNAASLIDSSITRYSLGKDLLYLKERGQRYHYLKYLNQNSE